MLKQRTASAGFFSQIWDNKRRYRNKTFAGLAKQGKSSMGFFYGLNYI
jgi:hypothetical protein